MKGLEAKARILLDLLHATPSVGAAYRADAERIAEVLKAAHAEGWNAAVDRCIAEMKRMGIGALNRIQLETLKR